MIPKLHRDALIASGTLIGAGMKYNMLWDGLFHGFTWLRSGASVGR